MSLVFIDPTCPDWEIRLISSISGAVALSRADDIELAGVRKEMGWLTTLCMPGVAIVIAIMEAITD